jgi:hypothetical protein
MAKKDSGNTAAGGTGKRAGKPASIKSYRLVAVSKKPIQVKHLNAPLRYVRHERIHARRVLPRVAEGKERAFHSLTRELTYQMQGAPVAIRATTDDLTLLTNTELSGPGQKQLASSVGEPSVAAAGQVVMYTGNWYAARSADGGQTFQYIDPFTSFPDPRNLAFCCDQVVNYIPSIDTFVWLLQYGPQTGPQADNIQRLAFAKSADVVAGRWSLFDITTAGIGVPGQFMDFPDLAVGAKSLYVTTNLFTPDGQSSGAAVIRIPLSSIGSGTVTAQPFLSTDLNSFRVAQNCGTTAFFAAHADTSTLRVFSWDETQATPISTDVGVARWIGGQGYQSSTPDGQRWLDRIDPRITGAALVNSGPTNQPDPELWFAWSVDRGSNHRPNAFVQIARIDATNVTLLDNIDIFDLNSATAYGALSSNPDNEIGISYMIGGPQQYPSLMVAILTNSRKDVLASAGERGTSDGQWGDFLAVRPVFPDRKLFAATGYTMKGAGDGSNRDATPRYVVFGRAGNATPGVGPGPDPGTIVPTPPVPPTPLPPTPPTDGGPITDVNTLPVVGPIVAAQIKAAAGLTTLGATQAFPGGVALIAPEADSPGTERWPVKTGQDPDRAKVGKNVINGTDLGAGIVEATLLEMISIPRPPGLTVPTQDPAAFQSVRDGVVEVTIWRVEAVIIALKHEKDGDYHLVLQGPSGGTMVAEVPTPTTVFVGDSPWLANIQAARQEVDQKLVKQLSPASFALVDGKYYPLDALSYLPGPRQMASPGLRFDTPPAGSGTVQPLFATRISATPVRITGVGFFDRAHGATGAAPNVIEIHPVLKVEFPPYKS